MTRRETWKMTVYQINALFKIHKRFNPERFKREESDATIEDIFGEEAAYGP